MKKKTALNSFDTTDTSGSFTVLNPLHNSMVIYFIKLSIITADGCHIPVTKSEHELKLVIPSFNFGIPFVITRYVFLTSRCLKAALNFLAISSVL